MANRYTSVMILIAAFGSITLAGSPANEAQDKKLFEAAQNGDKKALNQLRSIAEQETPMRKWTWPLVLNR